MANPSYELKETQPAVMKGVEGVYATVEFVAENGYKEEQEYFVPNAENTVLEDALAHFNESALALKEQEAQEFFHSPQVEPNDSAE